MIGKWHLGYNDKYHPNNRGVDFFFGFLAGGHDYFVWDTPATGAEKEIDAAGARHQVLVVVQTWFSDRGMAICA